MHHLGARRLRQHELVIPQRTIEFQLHRGQRDVVLFLGTRDFDLPGKAYAILISIVLVDRIRGNLPLIVVENLTVRQQVTAVEYHLAGKRPALADLMDHVDNVFRLLPSPFLADGYRFGFSLHDGNLVLRDFPDQQRVVYVSRPEILQRLGDAMALNVVAPDYKAILRRNRELEVFAVAHHVERNSANDGCQSHHAQHGGLAHHDISANLLIVSDLAFLGSAHRSVNINRGLDALDSGGLAVDVSDQFLLSRGFYRSRLKRRLDFARAE